MFRDGTPVERFGDLCLKAPGVQRRFTRRVLVELFRPRPGVTERVRIERPARMQVRFAVVDIAFGVALLRERRCRRQRQRDASISARLEVVPSNLYRFMIHPPHFVNNIPCLASLPCKFPSDLVAKSW